jgi:hypothetical protein
MLLGGGSKYYLNLHLSVEQLLDRNTLSKLPYVSKGNTSICDQINIDT